MSQFRNTQEKRTKAGQQREEDPTAAINSFVTNR